MAKFHGFIGFAGEQTETSPGIWTEGITDKEYSGDLLRFNRRVQGSGKVNDDMTISNQISVIADAYLNENLYAARYVTFMGAKWKIESVEVDYPRMIFTLGGIYNGSKN